MVFVYVTCKNLEEGVAISKAIIENKAAGCINMFPVKSVWRNDETNAVEEYEEAVLVVKTIDQKVHAVEEIVRKEGSYKTPCIATFTVFRMNQEYKNWLGRLAW